MKTNFDDCYTIEDVIESIESQVKHKVFFDDSRGWALYSVNAPELAGGHTAYKYGAYRPYLGGGIRGGIACNLIGDDYINMYVNGLKRIEEIINQDTEDMESWEQNTGVLL